MIYVPCKINRESVLAQEQNKAAVGWSELHDLLALTARLSVQVSIHGQSGSPEPGTGSFSF